MQDFCVDPRYLNPLLSLLLVFEALGVPQLRLGESHLDHVINCIDIILTSNFKSFGMLTKVYHIILD